MRQENVLANFSSLSKYKPAVGDFVIWTGWFSVWFGLVSEIGPRGALSVVFSKVPSMLFSMTEAEQLRASKIINLADITSAWSGTFAVQQFNQVHRATIWYI